LSRASIGGRVPCGTAYANPRRAVNVDHADESDVDDSSLVANRPMMVSASLCSASRA
jgi:hypothetical protein